VCESRQHDYTACGRRTTTLLAIAGIRMPDARRRLSVGEEGRR
jgi:hypothetical protein